MTNDAAAGREERPGTASGTRGRQPVAAVDAGGRQRLPGPDAQRLRVPVVPAHEPCPGTAAEARERVRRLLDGLAGAPLPQGVVNDILLVTSELVTNALRHGGGIAAFRAELVGGAVRVSVTDRSPTPPSSAPRRRVATPGGFGWPLVQRLSRSVAVTPARDGKTIEAVVSLTPDGT
ncbi:ATP-binding protein [Streptomyces wuyuanensis]|uniref:ATP-binding protein n=1 Tax=Streptomyces wuyuanensis TaxID=1196353 RepID=UPI0037A07A12